MLPLIEQISTIDNLEVGLSGYNGHEIRLDNCTVYFTGILNVTLSLETWGNFMAFNPQEVIGAGLIDLTLSRATDVLPADIVNAKLAEQNLDGDITADDCAITTLKTTKGDFHIIFFNQHNGYDVHDVIITNQIRNIIDDGYDDNRTTVLSKLDI